MGLFKLDRYKFGVLILLLFVVSGQAFAGEFIPELSGSIKEYQKATGVGEFTVLLSSPKRINNATQIETKVEVQGERLDLLIEVQDKYSVAEIFSFYQSFLLEVGEVAYQCEKRACGNSNFWANDFFNEHALYGRDSDQFYIVGKIPRQDTAEWLMIYVIKNGFKKNKVFITKISENTDKDVLSNGFLMSSSIDDSTIAIIQRKINKDDKLNLWLVAYSAQETSVKLDQTIKQLDLKAKAYIEILNSKLDISTNRLRTKIVGPFHSDNSMSGMPNWHRLYLLL